ncbi:stalk domain-containing protein [Paenibacillus sp. HWE-109]|uniref:stalk domain-containing protein n=1 Tax=Paenibacillus sp. HWE-109 TaxID=1306526 RepID=UPI001EDF0C56|nr:stalk domain-containing protein [Paenibacillus sp. HWE-109]UKS23905.1 stalk domain-containing protein [Paenibacillus sp. HWE-109]
MFRRKNGRVEPGLTEKGDIRQISSGYCYNLALLTDGTVWAWGDNTYGQFEKVLLDQVPIIKNELTLVPLRFITESFGGQVIWDENNKLIDLKIH